MRSYYWWIDFKVPRRQKTDAVRQLGDNHPPADWEIYSHENDNVNIATSSPTKATILGYLRAFGKPLSVMAFWLAVSIIFLIQYVPQLTGFGAGIILYIGISLIGIVVCVGLPIKWYLEYRAAGGRVFFSE